MKFQEEAVNICRNDNYSRRETLLITRDRPCLKDGQLPITPQVKVSLRVKSLKMLTQWIVQPTFLSSGKILGIVLTSEEDRIDHLIRPLQSEDGSMVWHCHVVWQCLILSATYTQPPLQLFLLPTRLDLIVKKSYFQCCLIHVLVKQFNTLPSKMGEQLVKQQTIAKCNFTREGNLFKEAHAQEDP
ncbi:hypothetical protein E2C01_029315 [Portunus trituberculatus]|uniref:Uncharacterized protein n=1 Tax=Portunus trituberculatus TaxID=210409 RepID=A0A5B7ERH7_PORTR|nr:hypothetical protein [Portunus trituberculatus]